MKYLLFYFFALLNLILPQTTHTQKLKSEEFSLKLIENCLNTTNTNENFIVAPYEAFQLYKEIFGVEDEASESKEIEDENENAVEPLAISVPTIRKQQKVLTSVKANNSNDLLSAITLTARWSFNFQTRDTHKRVFHQHGRQNQKMWVDFLRKDDTFYYAHDEQLNASILELPLNVKKIKLKLILPDKWNGLDELREYILENMEEFNELIKKTHKMTLVRLLLPKFHLSFKMNLKDFFEELSDKNIEQYENIYQQSKLEFNERGIGQFERTTVLFWNAYSYLRVSPELYDINHPFLFVITNKDGVQFFGQVVRMQH